MLLYIVRHGEPDYDNDTLTPLGFEQAEALAKKMKQSGITKVFSSPCGRAKHTAEPTCRELGLKMEVLDWLDEARNYDPDKGIVNKNGWPYNSPPETMKTDEVVAFGDKWYEAPAYSDFIGAKYRWDEVSECSDKLLERLGFRREGRNYRVIAPNDEKLAVFCHEGMSLVWLPQLLAIPPSLFWTSFEMTHSGVTVLCFCGGEGDLTAPTCLVHSDMSHLYKEGIKMKYSNGQIL